MRGLAKAIKMKISTMAETKIATNTMMMAHKKSRGDKSRLVV